MSVLASRSFTRILRGQLKKLSTRDRVIRFCSAAKEKSSNLENAARNGTPAAETGVVSAAFLNKFSAPLVLKTVDPPKMLRADEVRVDVQYCALNGSDVLLSQNLYTFEPTLPMILGYEFAGKLVEVGEDAKKQGYKIGDKVIALNKDSFGGLADQCIAGVSDIWKVPSGIKSIDAVALLNDYITALLALERKVSIQEEDIMLINVGTSSIGLAAADLATNVYKAQVISVCATEEGAALARDKGVLASFKYKDRKLLKQIEKVAADNDIEIVFEDADVDDFKKIIKCFTNIYRSDVTIKDLLRDDTFDVVVHHLSREGRAIIAGVATVADSDYNESKNGFTLSGFNLQKYRKKKPEAYRQAGEDVLEFFEEGLIKPTCALTVGLLDVNKALEFILKNKSPGKVIVDIKNR